MLGCFEFRDSPKTEEQASITSRQHIPASKVHEFLSLYTEHYGLKHLIRFCTTVESAELLDGEQWLLSIEQKVKPKPAPCQPTPNYPVVTTGILSDPFMPELKGQTTFKAPLFHMHALCSHASALQNTNAVVIFGASKSAWDACYLAAKQGCGVIHWIIRVIGNGPMWVVPPYATPLKLSLEVLLTTRVFTWFSPTSWRDADGYGWVQRFLHGTWLGRKVVAGYWTLVSADVVDGTGYDKHAETAKLKGRNPMFWGQSSANMLNYDPDFMALVRDEKIKIPVAEIEHLSIDSVHLSDGNELKATTLIRATGWKFGAHVKFLPEGIDQSLGTLHYSSTEERERDSLAFQADKVILEQFPMLRDQPIPNPAYTPLASSSPDTQRSNLNQPFRLYRFLVSPLSTATTKPRLLLPQCPPRHLEAHARTAASPLGNPRISAHAIPLPASSKVLWSTVLWSRFMACPWPWDAGGSGDKYQELTTEWLLYADTLLRGLGMKTLKARTGRSWWKDFFVSYKQEDFGGLLEEWLEIRTTM
jgi:hypothetical protein